MATPPRTLKRLLTLIGLALSISACTANGPPAPTPTTPPSSAQPTPAAQPTAHTTSPGQGSPSAQGVDKLLVIVEENRNAASVVAQMPYLRSQSQSYGRVTNYYAITHPSLPNYLVMAGGSTFGVEDDEDPDVHPQRGRSVFGQLLAAGRTAKTYAEAMRGNCALRNQGTYAVRHNPWTYFADRAERSACEKFDVPSGTTTGGALADDVAAGRLPNFGFLIPDDCNNGHSCSSDTTDRWLRTWLPVIQKGPDFRSGRLAVMITWDEDEGNTDNRVAMVVLHPALKGRTVTTRLDHYVLSATISGLAGAQPLRDARGAPDLLSAFGLRR
jgi:phosphatidylinositol-3-phosphatase